MFILNRFHGRLAALLTLLVGAILTATMAGAPSASALTVVGAWNTPGLVTFSSATSDFGGTALTAFDVPSGFGTVAGFRLGRLTIEKDPTSGAPQVAKVVVTVQKKSRTGTTWTPLAPTSFSQDILQDEVVLNEMRLNGQGTLGIKMLYRVVVDVTWYDKATGVYLGQTQIMPSADSRAGTELKCATVKEECSVSITDGALLAG